MRDLRIDVLSRGLSIEKKALEVGEGLGDLLRAEASSRAGFSLGLFGVETAHR